MYCSRTLVLWAGNSAERCPSYLLVPEGAYTSSWLATTHLHNPGSLHTTWPQWKRRIISTQFKLPISLASVSGYWVAGRRHIDYSDLAKSNYTADLFPINSPHGILTLTCSFHRRLSFSRRPLPRNVALQGPHASFWRVMALFRAVEICYTTLPVP